MADRLKLTEAALLCGRLHGWIIDSQVSACHEKLCCMAAPMLPRRRNAPRRRALKTGSIEFSVTAIECTIREMSEAGAALEVVSPLYSPDRFTLFSQREQSRRACRII